MIFRVILWAFILVMLVRFVIRFVFPILQITRTTQSRLRQMQQQMDDMQQNASQPKATKKAKEGDYIDYEEVK